MATIREWSLAAPRPARRFPAGWEARAASVPATEFTGDFFATAEVDGRVFFAVGDVAGHGLAASILTMMVQEELERLIAETCCPDPVETVEALDRAIREELPSNRFLSLVAGRAEADGSVRVVNAGHPPPLVVRADGTVATIPAGGPVVGIAPFACWCPETVRLAPGDRLVVYTDGLLEARDGDGAELGADRIAEAAQGVPPAATVEALLGAARSFSGDRVHDDLTVLVLSRA